MNNDNEIGLIKSIMRKDLLMLFSAAFFVFIIFFTSLTLLPLYVLEIGGTEIDAGLQSTLFFVMAVLLRLYFGPLADSKGRKIPLFIGAFVFTTSSIMFIYSTEVWQLTLARIYQSIGLATFLASASTMVADYAPAKFRGTYIGLYRFIITLALLIGPLVGMEVTQAYGFEQWYKISIYLGVVACIVILLIKPSNVRLNPNLKIFKSLKSLFSNKQLWPIFFGIALISLCYGILLTFATVYIAQATAIHNPGIYFTYFGIAGIIANLSIGYLSDKFGRSALVWPAVILLGMGFIILAFSSRFEISVLLSGLIAGFGYSGGIAALGAWLVDATNERIRATALSIQESIIDSCMAVGSMILGFLGYWFGMQNSIVIIGAFTIIISLMFFNSKSGKVKNLISEEENI